MSKSEISPHDRYFKSVFSDPKLAKEFLEKNLPEDVKQVVDLLTIKVIKDSYIDNRLRLEMSDLLLSVDMKKSANQENHKKGYIYILTEHMSTSDSCMPYRMLKYTMAVIKEHRKQNPKDKTLPFVYPILFHTGERRYKHSKNIYDLFGPHKDLAATYMFKDFHLIDLTEISDEKLKETYYWCLFAMILMKHIREKDLLRYIKDYGIIIMKMMDRAEEVSYIIRSLEYVYQAGEIYDENAYNELIQEHIATVKGESMGTLAEKYEKKGLERGRQEGRQEGMEKIIKRMLSKNMPLDLIVEATGLSAKDIHLLMQSKS